MDNLNLVQYLRKIRVAWDLSPPQLAKISHAEETILMEYFSLPTSGVEALPVIPTGLESAMPLVSVFKNIVRMIPDPEKQNEWLMSPNESFEGHKPIEVMAMSPAHLAWVSYTLESQTHL